MLLKGIRPTNRLRDPSVTSSIVCSHCQSLMSFNNCSRLTSRAASGLNSRNASQISLFAQLVMQKASSNPGGVSLGESSSGGAPRRDSEKLAGSDDVVGCKICLVDTPSKDMHQLQECGCVFCKDVSFSLHY